ncbi:hypothetical protein LTR05_003045 [Lithohypha guttulata]|uniref:Uncharacterized protein n=1 Tax=Lithohypha guttulata TaxID=1690604 RepID=A0AAN7T540_9EURO|nr:hypothetical protein LTR05_003045 [Lithohypha guttulata]
MGPPAPPPPSPEEAQEIKHQAARSIASLLPAVVTRRYYATNDDSDLVDQIEQDILEPFDDVYLNKHLIYAILELILVKLIPELGQQTITDLLADRGVVSDEDFGPVAISPDTDGDENVDSPKVA